MKKTYEVTAPNSEKVRLTSKLEINWVVWTTINYGDSFQDWKICTVSSKRELAEKKASALEARCRKNGFAVKTWITYAEEVAA